MNTNSFASIRIGDVLKEFGYVTDAQIAQALEYQDNNKGIRLGDALVQLGFISEKQMLQAMASRMEYPLVDVQEIKVDIDAVAKVPKFLAEKYCMMGYLMDDTSYYLLVNDPMNFYAIEDIRQIVGLDINIALCEKAELLNAISYYYSEVSARDAASRAAAKATVIDIPVVDLNNASDDTPIINLFNSLIIRAYNSNVSDIHIEPYEYETRVRMRMDGVIMDFMTLQKNIHNSLITRIKILGDLDIAEKRVPQDGHFKLSVEGHNLNFRVSVIPTVFGEKAVLRILSSAALIDNEETFGMSEANYKLVKKMLTSPNGMIYVTGPTGSGKTTTLYMILSELSKKQVNISTIEDPVEKNLPGVNQMQVNNQAGLTFERGLRALLRQDPDVIMLGETRDNETATIAVRAAITGHLVLSTLHTNDAAGSVIRLADMGVEPYMIAGSLVGIVAQRLVRKVCPFCGEEAASTAEEEQLVGKRIPVVMRARGCSQCNNTGYKGRIAIHEILPVNKVIREMITSGATTDQIKDYAVYNMGMKTLKDSALELVENKITTMEELAKVAYYEFM